MIELIAGLSMIASTVALKVNASGIAASTATTTTSAATTTVIEQVIDERQPVHPHSYREHVTTYFKEDPILVEIARCESQFRQYRNDGGVIRGIENNKDVGIMQINEYYHLETSKKLGYDIYTVEGNLAYGKYLYEKQGAAPWSASSPCWSKSGVVATK